MEATVSLEGVRGPLIERGWVRLRRAISEEECSALLDRGEHAWRPLAAEVGQVRQAGWYCQPPVAELPNKIARFAQALGESLAAEVEKSGFPEAFNEVSWQRHVPSEVAVGPHRDQSFYTGAIVVVTLVGSARFSMLASRDAADEIDAWDTEPGDVVLMRGAGLGDPSARCPWHQVAAPADGERQTLTLRHTVGTPGGWE